MQFNAHKFLIFLVLFPASFINFINDGHICLDDDFHVDADLALRAEQHVEEPLHIRLKRVPWQNEHIAVV